MQQTPANDTEATEATAAAEAHDELAAWLYAAATGDGEAFGLFYDATIGNARAVARRLLGRLDAEDLVADVFFEVWRNASRFDRSRGSALGWLLCIVKSRSLDQLRRRVTHPSVGNQDEAHAAELLDPAPDPVDLLAQSQACRRLHAAVAKLSGVERDMVGLAYFRDLSHSEIALSTGLPLGTVKSHLGRVQRKLRVAMSPLSMPQMPPRGSSLIPPAVAVSALTTSAPAG